LVLGNDIAGTIESVGAGVAHWQPGDRVFGLIPTGKGGAHASHVVAEEHWLRGAVGRYDATELAAFPYTFTTLWQSLRTAGLREDNARNREVLVNGASGGLGRMAIQILVRWGARVTAICSGQNIGICKDLGASMVWNRSNEPLEYLPRRFDAVLNFGTWANEEKLLAALKPGAMGAATTVHPLLSNFDKLGWGKGAWQTRCDLKRVRALAAAKGARYGWVVFRPDSDALDVLHGLLTEGALALPVGMAVPFSGARKAFDHVAWLQPGRAVLLPFDGG
jgi:NADPH:quinone reductase-like Zn-dependent oxidoreductase